MGKTSSAVKNKYNAKTYDRIEVVVKKGGKERLKEAAAATGQSTNGFIRSALNKAVQDATGAPMEAVDERMERDMFTAKKSQ